MENPGCSTHRSDRIHFRREKDEFPQGLIEV